MNTQNQEKTAKNKEFYNDFYKKGRTKRTYFKELEYFLEVLGDCSNRTIVSIGNGDKDPFFADQIVSDISLEGVKKIPSGKRCVFDAHHLPFKESSIDVFYGWQVVHHLDIDKFLQQLKRVLKKEGKAIFVDNAYSPQWRLLRKILPRSPVDPREDLREVYLAEKVSKYGFVNFKTKRFNFFAYLFNKSARSIGFDISLKFLEKLDSRCSGLKLFRNNLRNLVWSFES